MPYESSAQKFVIRSTMQIYNSTQLSFTYRNWEEVEGILSDGGAVSSPFFTRCACP